MLGFDCTLAVNEFDVCEPKQLFGAILPETLLSVLIFADSNAHYLSALFEVVNQ